MEKKNKIEIGFLFGIFILYSLFLLNTDVLCLIFYYLGINSLNHIAIIIAAILTIVLLYFCRSRLLFKRYYLDSIGWIVIALIFLLGIIRGIIPDTSSDVSRAHIFFQEIGFEDNINKNAFPAGYTFYFYLADDFAYYFRLILGYRLGTLANAFSLTVAFLEMRELLKDYGVHLYEGIRTSVSEKSIKSPIYFLMILGSSESFWAGAGCLSFYAISELGSYMADIVGLPIMLYLVRVALKKEKDVCIYQFAFFALLCGLCFAYKQTGIILIIPVLIIYLIRHRKDLNIKIVSVCFLIGVFPSLPYLIYSYVSTGNPVYITFNSIFKSPYYFDVDFKDTNWGPQNITDVLWWPLKLVFDNQTRVSEIIMLPLSYILLGFIIVFENIYYFIREKNYELKKFTMQMIAIFVSAYLLWLQTTGYSRYAIICEMLAVILIGIGVVNRFHAKKTYKNVFSMIMILLVFFQCSAYVTAGLINSYDWSWRGSTLSNYKSGVLADNAKWFLRDRRIGTDEQRKQVDMFLLTTGNSAAATLFDPEIPIIGAINISTYLGGLENVKGINYVENYKQYVLRKMQGGERVYDIIKLIAINNSIDIANTWGVEFTSIKWMDTFFVDNEEIGLVEFKPLEYGNSYIEFDNKMILERVSDNATSLNGFIYLHPSTTKETSTLQIVGCSPDGEKILTEFTLHANEVLDISSFNDQVDLSDCDTVEIRVIDGIQHIYAINLRLEG